MPPSCSQPDRAAPLSPGDPSLGEERCGGGGGQWSAVREQERGAVRILLVLQEP